MLILPIIDDRSIDQKLRYLLYSCPLSLYLYLQHSGRERERESICIWLIIIIDHHKLSISSYARSQSQSSNYLSIYSRGYTCPICCTIHTTFSVAMWPLLAALKRILKVYIGEGITYNVLSAILHPSHKKINLISDVTHPSTTNLEYVTYV